MGSMTTAAHCHVGHLFPARAGLAGMFNLDEWLASMRPFELRGRVGARSLRISICAEPGGILRRGIEQLAADLRACGHHVRRVHRAHDLEHGDICLFLGGAPGLDAQLASYHTHNLLVSEVDPRGGRIPVVVLTADESLEGGLRQLEEFTVPVPEDDSLAAAVRRLCLSFVKRYPDSLPRGLR